MSARDKVQSATAWWAAEACGLPHTLKKTSLLFWRALWFRWREMHETYTEVSGQLPRGGTAVTMCKVFTGTHQDNALPCSKYLRNYLLAGVVVGEGDRATALIVAVAKRLHMLIPGTEQLRELVLAPSWV